MDKSQFYKTVVAIIAEMYSSWNFNAQFSL